MRMQFKYILDLSLSKLFDKIEKINYNTKLGFLITVDNRYGFLSHYKTARDILNTLAYQVIKY